MFLVILALLLALPIVADEPQPPTVAQLQEENAKLRMLLTAYIQKFSACDQELTVLKVTQPRPAPRQPEGK